MSDHSAILELALQATRDQLNPLTEGAASELADTVEPPSDKSEESLVQPEMHPKSNPHDSQALASEVGGLSLIDAFYELKTLLRESLKEQGRLIDKNLEFQSVANEISTLSDDPDFTRLRSDTINEIKGLIDGHRQDYFESQCEATYNSLLAKAAQFDEASLAKAFNLLEETINNTANLEVTTHDIQHRELMQ
jgi:hypothetical protein